MPRPSLKDERRSQILEAYGRCVARYGVEGATLERTAEEADIARALIRHNVGNKDELLDAFVAQFLEKASAATDELFASLPDEDRPATMIEWLFDPSYSDAHEISVTNALITAAIERSDLAEQLGVWTKDFVDAIEKELRDAFPKADKKTLQAVAAGVAGIYFNADTMTPLGGMEKLVKASETAAHLLVSTLDAH